MWIATKRAGSIFARSALSRYHLPSFADILRYVSLESARDVAIQQMLGSSVVKIKKYVLPIYVLYASKNKKKRQLHIVT
jgi:hypothetical protein